VTKYSDTEARAKSLPTPRIKPKVAMWVGGGLLFVGLSSFVLMFIIHATLKHWW